MGTMIWEMVLSIWEIAKPIVQDVASMIIAGGVICGFALKIGKQILDKTLKPFNDRMDTMDKTREEQHQDTIQQINNVQLYSDKNFLVRFLADIEQDNQIDEVEKERFYEVYKNYKDLGGNSYIQHKVEKLQKEGKL
jgi:hypothetical protein